MLTVSCAPISSHEYHLHSVKDSTGWEGGEVTVTDHTASLE